MKQFLVNIANYIWSKMQRWDAVWALPLSVIAFFAFGYIAGRLGLATGTYDIAFFQPLALAVCVTIGASTAAIYGLRFQFKRLFNYIYSRKSAINSFDDFEKMEAWQRFLVTLFLFLVYFLSVILVYISIV